MSLKNIRMALYHPQNKGHFVSAKIYSDMKKSCSCGERRVKYINFHNYKIPECLACGKPPEVYVIAATVIDLAGVQSRIRIRHSQSGERFTHAIDVLAALRQITTEMQRGTFDLRRYMSNQSREGFKFSSIIKDYIAANERKLARNELTPSGFSNKIASIKNLQPYFGDTDIVSIDDRMIRMFYDSYTEKLRTRDKAVQELKTILRFALDDGKIDKLPKFPATSSSKIVSSQNFLDKDSQRLVISHIKNETYRKAITTLALYALRPCEIRSLKWKDIDRKKNVFYIQSHFSKGSDIAGRKSQSDASHELPIVPEFEMILDSIPHSIHSDDYVFRGEKGSYIGTNTLTRAWNEACRSANVPKVTLYQGTKHSTLSQLSSSATDAQLVKLSGHSSAKMLRRYAQSSLEEVRRLLDTKSELFVNNTRRNTE